MPKSRLEAFTDGVIAIIITIMVLELRPPVGGTFAALWGLRYAILIYLVSFFTLAVYWNNHHHLFLIVRRISGRVLWANVLFLFTISLFPFVTAWVGEHHVGAAAPEMTYGIVVAATNFAFYLLIRCLSAADQHNAAFAQLVGAGYYKPLVSVVGAVVAIGLALVWPPLTILVDTALLLLWVRPERRIEAHVAQKESR
ncbi:TMEM175 family protein [Lacticaseibacillus parakribbianus]|uniref:TMEM175 family protein n=1 Tax=Lacticaseibacillus parakribbianus TaxID=2970927 RepID=UPI0021CB6192|nr:TMEM175 family protein [Lacticaseibacillus parakribbianus]